MAELALGLTKTVVEGALSRIQWAIEEEGKLKEGVQQDLEFITGEFQMMQSFLKVANKERARNNEVVRTWVRQFRDLAFDVEDWVEFVAHLDKDMSLCSCWWRLVPSWAVPRCLALPRHLDDAAADMKLLKARVHDVSQRNTRYNLFNSDDSGSGSGLDSKTVMPTIADLSSSTAFQILRQVWRDETHRLRQVDSLTNLITSQVGGDALEVIWLWGADYRSAPDHIHMAYQDPEICRWFDRRAWIKISHPFNLQVFLGTLVAQLLFVGFSHQQAANNGLISTPELIQQETKEQRYLVVLEDVSDLVDWNTIKLYLPNNKKGSRIVVSTQNLRQAILCTGEPYLVSEIGRFADRRPSICAFYRKITARWSDSDMDILSGKLKRGVVISMYGDVPKKSSVVKMSYLSMVHQNRGVLDRMGFESLIWVPVSRDGVPYRLVDFSPLLVPPLSYYYGFLDSDLEDMFKKFGGRIVKDLLCEAKLEELIERSREFLRKRENCLVVIDGLQSTKGWDYLVKSAILPDEPAKCCVVVVTDNQTVARHCVDGNEDLLVHVSEVQEEIMLPGPNLGRRRLKLFDWIESKSHPSLAKRCKEYNSQITYNCLQSGTSASAVASVWGIAGGGKSALAGWTFTDSLLDAYPGFNHYCWVDVPHPFRLADLSLGLLHEFTLKDPRCKEQDMISILQGDRDPIQECRSLLHQNSWLLVLDDLWSTDEWDTINDAFCLSQPTHESKTIVITNKRSVAMHCVDKEDKQMVSVQALEADEALNLFNEKIRSNDEDLEPSDMKLSKSIMAKCGGLPKVIHVVANHFNMSYGQDYSKLKNINDNFMHILEGAHSLRGLFSWMQSYLETCNDVLKPCIFYLPVFPIGHSIRLRRLVWRWVAEGYIMIRGASSHTTNKHIEMLLSELWESSMFQLEKSSKPLKCQVNGFLHEYINSRPMEDNLVFALDGPCGMQSQRAGGQHLTVRDNWVREMNVFQSIDFSGLRSFTVFGECMPFMFDPTKINMRYVRVLDLEDATGVTNDDLKHIVEVFPRLKFLSLRGCTKISRLPKSLGRLRQLQTLDVRHTYVATLPNAILKLQKLQNVRVGTIQSAPWDEDGIMVPYQTRIPEEFTSTSVPPEDAARTPSVPPEVDVITVAATPSSSASEDATRIATVPLSPELTTAVAAALWAQTEDRKTVAVAPLAPEQDARTGTTAPSALEEDPTIVVTDPRALAEDTTVVAAVLSTPPAEDTKSMALAAVEDTTIVEAAPLIPAQVATTVAAAPMAPAEDRTTGANSQLAPVQGQADGTSEAAAAPGSKPHALLPTSWLSKLCCRQTRHDNAHHGVEVPAGIGKLMALNTFGIIHVGHGNKAVILKELHKLTQLRRLGVCGINMHNIRDFFSAILDLKHLRKLSVRLDKSMDGRFACLDGTIPLPHETLDYCLKLHGHVRILPSCSWIKKLPNVPKMQFEVTLQEQQDMQVILDQLMHDDSIRHMKRLSIKPIHDGELRIGINDERKFVGLRFAALEIVCTTNLQATIGNIGNVDVLRVECSSGSSLQLSGLQGIRSLSEVWLKGSCSDALKEDLQRQLAQHKGKPVLKVLQPRLT